MGFTINTVTKKKDNSQQLTLKNANQIQHFFWFYQNFNEQIELLFKIKNP